MNKQLLAIAFICLTSISWGQINEFGLFIGGTNYVGDVGKTNYIAPNNISPSIIYKYNLNPRVAIRSTLSFYTISGDDAESSDFNRVNRSFNFKNSLTELALGIEYNFFEYDMTSKNKIYTPYILVGLAGVSYDKAFSEATNGQYNLKNKFSYSIPFGLGFKGKLANKIGFAIETKVNYMLEDDLDYTTTKIASLNFGGSSNDWYMFTGISIVYAFGRPSCYVRLR